MGALKDLAGKKFGRLTVQNYLGGGKWQCRCECGNTSQVITTNLTRGNSTSCGCKHDEARFRHGMTHTRIYRVWTSMRHRCNNPGDLHFHNYGGRGIRVCERWNDFQAFLVDMGMRPDGFELDRIDNDGPYSPENCRWVSKKQNLHNKRTNHIVEWDGASLPIAEWARRLHIPERTLSNRINRGWPIEKAMTLPKHARKKSRKGD